MGGMTRKIGLSPLQNLAGALTENPPSQKAIDRAGTMAVQAAGVEDRWWIVTDVWPHRVHLGGNSATCDCTAASNGRICSHMLAVIAHTGWQPSLPKVTVPEDPFEGLV